MIHSDYHIHSEYSYDATLTLDELLDAARVQGLRKIGITDHVNYNDKKFLSDLYASAKAVSERSKTAPELLLGVELTPIAKPHFDYMAKYGSSDGFVFPQSDVPSPIELAVTKEELKSLGVRYAVCAAHWRVDIPLKNHNEQGCVNETIREWHRQQLFLATDERTTILGHPWWPGAKGLWEEDFSIIPHSMHDELIAALKENGKYAECSLGLIVPGGKSEKFTRQYAEFLREIFEAGVPITFATDAHRSYPDRREAAEAALKTAGFKDGDIVEISEKDLW
jgi:histidinol phosphatase-like PHP family hydrolase